MARWLAALDRSDVRERADLIRDIQERVQRLAVEGITGKNLVELGARQAAFRRRAASRIAGAPAGAEGARTTATPRPVTDAERRAQLEETGRLNPITPSTVATWTPEDQRSWSERAAAVIPLVVAACARIAPEFGLTAEKFRFDQVAIVKDGGDVFPMSVDSVVVIGTEFVRLAELDPNYVVRTVVHEFAGHADLGGRRGRFQSYAAQIHTAALRVMSPDSPHWEQRLFLTLGLRL